MRREAHGNEEDCVSLFLETDMYQLDDTKDQAKEPMDGLDRKKEYKAKQRRGIAA